MSLQQHTVASDLPKRVEELTERNFICLPEDMLVGEAVKIMRAKDVSSILVARPYPNQTDLTSKVPSESRYVGILTERDILYRVMAENKGPYKVTLGQIMSTPLVTISKDTQVRDAISLMQSKQIRRLPIVDEREKVIGLVTMKTVIGNMPSHNIDLAELESSRVVAEREMICPYCRSVIKHGNTMADHMSSAHMHE
ncbi:MAG TPA: CBS domain-containing protein [Nitrososphaera sp.]|nr:CBS domain-containing protein [Nitrososphaera sp.]